MATDIRDLRVRVRADDAVSGFSNIDDTLEKLAKTLDRLANNIGQTSNQFDQLADEVAEATEEFSNFEDNVALWTRSAIEAGNAALILGPAIAGLAVVQTAKAFADTAMAIEAMEGRLITATESVEDAAVAMSTLREFTRDIPLSTEEAVASFAKLTNIGLKPTIENLRGFGNLATALQRDLGDVTDAILDASIGQFDALENYGIVIQDENDKLRVIFRDTETEIERSTGAIIQHLTDLGNTTFSGAMDDQMQSVTGAVKNFEGALSGLATTMVDLLSPAFVGVTNHLANILQLTNSFIRAVFNLNKESLDLTQQLNNQRELVLLYGNEMEKARARSAKLLETEGRLSQAYRESEYNLEGKRLEYEREVQTLRELGLEYQKLGPQIDEIPNTLDRFGDSAKKNSDKARRSLTDLIVSIRQTRDEIAAMGEAEAMGFTLGNLQQQLGSYNIRQEAETIGFDFAEKFWDVFQNQGEFTLDSLVGTFQSWGLELAQTVDFSPLFDKLKVGLGESATNGLTAALGGFGVGATAGGLVGGPGGILAGIGGGALTGGFAAGPVGAIVGGVLGGLGAALGSGSGSPDQYGFSVFGGLGGLRGAGGPGQGNFSQFIAFINELESSIARTFGPERLGEMQRALEDFRSAEIRMAEGGFEAERAMRLVRERLNTLVEGMGAGFLRLFQELGDGTAEGTARAVESLIAVDRAMEAFNINIRDARNLIEEAAFYGESYAQTLERIASAQATLEAALYTAEERQQRELANAQQRINAFNRELGLTGDAAIDTREELRAYNDTLDLSQQAQHAAYLELLDVADAFQLVFEAAEAATPAIEDVAEEIEQLEQEAFDATSVIRDVVSLLSDYVAWNYRLADAMNAATGEMAAWELALDQTRSTVALFNVARGAGAPLEQQMQLFNQAFAQFQRAYQLAMQQIAEDLQNRISAIREEYADLIDQERRAFDLRRDALQSELEITRAWASTLSSIESIISGLQSGSASPFGPFGQMAIGQGNIAALQAQFGAASGAGRAALGAQLAQALSGQLGLASGAFGVGSFEYLEEYNRTMEQLTAIQQEAAAEAARQTALEQAMAELEAEQTARLEQLNQQMENEIAAAESHAQSQIDAVNNFAMGVYQQVEQVGRQLYEELLAQRLEQAAQEAEGRRIQADQLTVLIDIRDGFINAGLLDPAAAAKVQARVGRYT